MGRLNVQIHEFRMRRSAKDAGDALNTASLTTATSQSFNNSRNGSGSTNNNPFDNDDGATAGSSTSGSFGAHEPAAGGGGKNDDRPYAVVSADSFCLTRCGNNPIEKSVFSENINTNPKEILRFVVEESADVLRVEVWSHCHGGYFFSRKQMFHGMCSVKLDPDAGTLAAKALRRATTTDLWHPIYKKGQLRGEIRLSIEAVDFGSSGYVGVGSMGASYSYNSHGYDRNKAMYQQQQQLVLASSSSASAAGVNTTTAAYTSSSANQQQNEEAANSLNNTTNNANANKPSAASSSNTANEFPDDFGIGVPKDKKPKDAYTNQQGEEGAAQMVIANHNDTVDPFAGKPKPAAVAPAAEDGDASAAPNGDAAATNETVEAAQAEEAAVEADADKKDEPAASPAPAAAEPVATAAEAPAATATEEPTAPVAAETSNDTGADNVGDID